VTPKHPPGPPMDLADMRRNGVRNLIAYCLTQRQAKLTSACRLVGPQGQLGTTLGFDRSVPAVTS
jgi:hypothetical protein